ncbi:unnamed protein product [Linum trigynum]|uniref:Uncharacterized protein n=1 Tax=Linum trigynum TaxID=586398 RepID=A0AAV2EP24_9ROSI
MHHSSSSGSYSPLFDLSLTPPSFPDDDDDDDGFVELPADELPPDSPPSTAPSSPGSSSTDLSSPSPPPVEPPRRSLRSIKGVPPVRHMDYLAYSVDPIPVPTLYSQAKGHPEWDNAMADEIDALHTNHT